MFFLNNKSLEIQVVATFLAGIAAEFMTYATSPDYSIDMIDVRDDMKRMFVYCQKR